MNGYTKLFGSIIGSTIWRETPETKVVWITMLAMANRYGIVEVSLPGLADLSRITLDKTKEAIEVLESPDTFSRTKDFEGRRIQPTDGGWLILNHAKYREKMSVDERREYNRVKQAEHRARRSSTSSEQTSNSVNHSRSVSAKSAHTEAEADTKADTPRASRSEGERREAERKPPESLNTAPFRLAWGKWCSYSADRNYGKPLPFATVDSHLVTLTKLGAVDAVAAIENAIARNLREPALPNDSKPSRAGASNRPPAQPIMR